MKWLRSLFGCSVCGAFGHGKDDHCPIHKTLYVDDDYCGECWTEQQRLKEERKAERLDLLARKVAQYLREKDDAQN